MGRKCSGCTTAKFEVKHINKTDWRGVCVDLNAIKDSPQQVKSRETLLIYKKNRSKKTHAWKPKHRLVSSKIVPIPAFTRKEEVQVGVQQLKPLH